MLPAFFFVWYHDVMIRKWGFSDLGLQRLATVPCVGVTLTTVRMAATKVVRPKVTKNLGTQMKVKRRDMQNQAL